MAHIGSLSRRGSEYVAAGREDRRTALMQPELTAGRMIAARRAAHRRYRNAACVNSLDEIRVAGGAIDMPARMALSSRPVIDVPEPDCLRVRGKLDRADSS